MLCDASQVRKQNLRRYTLHGSAVGEDEKLEEAEQYLENWVLCACEKTNKKKKGGNFYTMIYKLYI